MTDCSRLVSIVIPFYNAGGCLVDCVNSLLRQSYSNVELILIDDGSTDTGGKIADDFAQENAKVRVIHSVNRGPSAARNLGLEHVKGQFVVFVDCDDLVPEHSVQTLIDWQVNNDLDLVYGDFLISRDGRAPIDGPYLLDGNVELFGPDGMGAEIAKYLLRPTGYSLFVSVWAKLFRVEIIRKHELRFNESVRVYEDTAFVLDFLSKSAKCGYVRQHLYTYFAGSESSTSVKSLLQSPLSYKLVIEKAGSLRGCYDAVDEKLVANAHVQFALRTVIRLSKAAGGFLEGYRAVRAIMAAPDLRHDLKHYIPFKGDSRVLPVLMGFGLPFMASIYVRYLK